MGNTLIERFLKLGMKGIVVSDMCMIGQSR